MYNSFLVKLFQWLTDHKKQVNYLTVLDHIDLFNEICEYHLRPLCDYILIAVCIMEVVNQVYDLLILDEFLQR